MSNSTKKNLRIHSRKKRLRQSGEGTVTHLPNKKWKARVPVRSSDGTLRYKSRTRATKADAEAARKKLVRDRDDGRISTTTHSVGGFLDFWLRDVIHGERASGTFDSYRFAVNKHLKPRLGKKKLASLNKRDVLSFLSEMKRDEVGDRTRLNSFVILKAALRCAVSLDEIPLNPCEGIERPKCKVNPITPFTVEESVEVIERAKGLRLFACVVLGFTSGMREGEILGLTWDSIDFKKRSLSVEWQLTESFAKIEHTKQLKTKTSRRKIDLSDLAVDALADRRVEAMKEGIDKLVFTGSNGGQIWRSTFRRFWNPLLKSCGIEHRGFHHTRHTFATHMLNEGVPINVVAKTLGHANPETTLRLYAHYLEGMQEKVTAAAQKLFG